MALEDRFAQHNFVMAFLEGRVQRVVGRPVAGHGIVEGAKTLLESVRETLVVPAGKVGKLPRHVGQEGGIANQGLLTLLNLVHFHCHSAA